MWLFHSSLLHPSPQEKRKKERKKENKREERKQPDNQETCVKWLHIYPEMESLSSRAEWRESFTTNSATLLVTELIVLRHAIVLLSF